MRDLTDLRLYADAIRMWGARYDTAAIAGQLKIPEHVVARWIANYREMMNRGVARA